MPLWLVGMMGSGKSVVGQLLAARTRREFVDTDRMIEEEAGRTIRQIWEDRGEDWFRARERAVIQRLTDRSELVVATGGGVVMDSDNVADMRRSGRVIWLDARPMTLAARVGEGIERPLLAEGDSPAVLVELVNQRRPFYLAAAHFRVSTDGRTPEEVAADVEDMWSGS